MIELRVVDTLAQQKWLGKASKSAQKAVQSLFKAGGWAAQPIADALHGTWLGHPLHPMLTDVPLGAWTATVMLDGWETLTGQQDFTTGADAALALGLAAAVPTAAAGWTDWQHTGGGSRRIGVVHGLLNLAGVLCFGLSLVQRLSGQRGAARGSASLGYTALLASAYLGGHLVYDRQIGVNHAALVEGPDDFVAVLPDAELREGEPYAVEASGARIVLVRNAGRISALADVCAHQGGPLSEGHLQDGGIVCPWHGSCFALADGRVLDGPSAFPQPTFETRVREGQIEVRAGR